MVALSCKFPGFTLPQIPPPLPIPKISLPSIDLTFTFPPLPALFLDLPQIPPPLPIPNLKIPFIPPTIRFCPIDGTVEISP